MQIKGAVRPSGIIDALLEFDVESGEDSEKVVVDVMNGLIGCHSCGAFS